MTDLELVPAPPPDDSFTEDIYERAYKRYRRALEELPELEPELPSE